MPYDNFGNWYLNTGMGEPCGPYRNMGPANTPQNPPNQQYMQTNQLQQYTSPQAPQQPSRPPLCGRIIDEDKDILPKEIPMDGSVSVFPKADFSYILAKAWNSNGTIDTVKFIPDIPVQAREQPSSDGINQILEMLSEMKQTIAKLDKELNG